MTDTEPIHRTTLTVEVFSRGPLTMGDCDGDPFDLETINYLITEGPCIGNVEVTGTDIIPAGEVEAHLLRIGNDGTFFEEID